MKKKNSIFGFTLLEVLLSLSILSLLMLLGISYMQKEKQKESLGLVSQQMNALLNAAIQYHMAYFIWPPTLDALTPLLPDQNSTTSPFYSPWRDNNGPIPYTLANNTNYFAVQVATPSNNIAQQLVTTLANSYRINNSATVVAYTTTFTGLKLQPPSGVLYGTGNFNTQLVSNNDCLNFYNANYSTSGPFGLLDATSNNPTVKISCQIDSAAVVYYVPNDPKNAPCPSGSQAYLLNLPSGLVGGTNRGMSMPIGFSNVFAHAWHDDDYINSNHTAMGPCMTTNAPYRSMSLSFSDIVCLSPNNTTRWPDSPSEIPPNKNPNYLSGACETDIGYPAN